MGTNQQEIKGKGMGQWGQENNYEKGKKGADNDIINTNLKFSVNSESSAAMLFLSRKRRFKLARHWKKSSPQELWTPLSTRLSVCWTDPRRGRPAAGRVPRRVALVGDCTCVASGWFFSSHVGAAIERGLSDSIGLPGPLNQHLKSDQIWSFSVWNFIWNLVWNFNACCVLRSSISTFFKKIHKGNIKYKYAILSTKKFIQVIKYIYIYRFIDTVRVRLLN